MKRLSALLLAALMVIALTACAESAEEKVENPVAEQTAIIPFDLSGGTPQLVLE